MLNTSLRPLSSRGDRCASDTASSVSVIFPEKERFGAERDLISAAIEKQGADLVLIIDSIHHLLEERDGLNLLAKLQLTREAIKFRSGMSGSFLLVGCSSDEIALRRIAAGPGV